MLREVDSTSHMELLAVFESSSRKLLPKRYRGIEIDDLQARLRALKVQVP